MGPSHFHICGKDATLGKTHSEWVAIAIGLLLLKQNPFPISASLILIAGTGSPSPPALSRNLLDPFPQED